MACDPPLTSIQQAPTARAAPTHAEPAAEPKDRAQTQARPQKRGRPTTYTREIADEVCRRLERTYSLIRVCRADDMPAESSVRGWVLDDTDGFAARYARAREVGYQTMAEELVDLADDNSRDWIDENGERRVDHENVQRSRLMVDTRKWLLSKVLPKIYGDRLALTDADGGPLQVAVVRYDLPAPGDGAKVIEHEPKDGRE